MQDRRGGRTGTGARVDDVLGEVAEELRRAAAKFPPFRSAHEGLSILEEEVDELVAEVRRKRSDPEAMRREAIQVCAMAARFVLDLVPLDPAGEVAEADEPEDEGPTGVADLGAGDPPCPVRRPTIGSGRGDRPRAADRDNKVRPRTAPSGGSEGHQFQSV